MAYLNRKILRKLILQEFIGLVDEDALLASPKLGEPHYLDVLKADHDEGLECPTCAATYTDGACQACGDSHDDHEHGCGGSHDRNTEVDTIKADIDWENPSYGHFRGNVDELDPHAAFGTGYAMGQSGDFDDESEQDDNLPLISYLKEFFITKEKY